MTGQRRQRFLDVPAEGRAQGTLVLVHAFPLGAGMWQPQLALARLGWRVVAPELRQFGGNGADEPPAGTMDDYAGDIVDLLDSLHVDQAVIAGLSMGGYVAFAILRHASRYIRGLILADTRPQADTSDGVEGRRRMLTLVQERGAAAVADEMVPKLLGVSTRRTRPDLVRRVRELIEANPVTAIAGGLSALMTRPDSSPLLATIHVPTLIVVGDEDTITPPAVSEGMRAAIAGSELVRVSGAGHLPNLEQPETFNAALAHFLSHRA